MFVYRLHKQTFRPIDMIVSVCTQNNDETPYEGKEIWKLTSTKGPKTNFSDEDRDTPTTISLWYRSVWAREEFKSEYNNVEVTTKINDNDWLDRVEISNNYATNRAKFMKFLITLILVLDGDSSQNRHVNHSNEHSSASENPTHSTRYYTELKARNFKQMEGNSCIAQNYWKLNNLCDSELSMTLK